MVKMNKYIKYIDIIIEMYTIFKERACKYLHSYDSDNDDTIIGDYINCYQIETEEYTKLIQNSELCNDLDEHNVISKIIPCSLIDDLASSINIFSNKKTKDYHPKSDKKVLDIVHPSLYPYISEPCGQCEPKTDFWNRSYETSKYQWLPSVFDINEAGECNISSYINNLPITENVIYEKLEALFEYVLPEFEETWSYINSVTLFNKHDGPDDHMQNDSKVFKKLSLKGMKLQVITKIVRISLKSNSSLDGAWHVEGMSHENIVATASCTLEQTSNFNAALYFKRGYTLSEANHITNIAPCNAPFELDRFLNSGTIPLGKKTITKDSLIVFPNSHIHKVDMRITEGHTTDIQNGTRLIVVFWLVNPNVSVVTTANIDQQEYCIKLAKKNRLALMRERTLFKNTFNSRDLNLCEH